MGNSLSQERIDELNKELEDNAMKDIMDEEKKLRYTIAAINSIRQEEYASAIRKNEREVQAESQKSLRLLDEALEELEDLKQKHKTNYEEWKTSLMEQGKAMRQDLKEEGEAQLDRKQKEYREKAEFLEGLRNELKEKRNQFFKSVEEENEKRKKLQKDHDEHTEKMTKAHRDQLLNEQKRLHDFQDSIKNDQKKVLKEERARQIEMANEQGALNEKRLNSVHHMVKAVKEDEQNLEFKTELDEIRVLHGRFSRAHRDDERVLRRMMFDMEQGEKLKSTPQIDDTLKSLNDFYQKTQFVHQNLPKEYQFLSETFRGVQTKKQQIEDSIEGIQNSVKKYKKAWKTARDQKTLFVNLELPIKTQFEVLRNLVKELDELVLKFNVDPSNQLQSAIEDSMKASSSTFQITNGSTQSKQVLEEIEN